MSVQGELRKLYQEYAAQMNKLGAELVAKVVKYIDDGLTTTQAIDKALSESTYFVKVDTAIVSIIYRAACVGYGVLPGNMDKQTAARQIVLNESWTPDKMKLSERLHGKSASMRQAIVDTVQAGFKQRKSVAEIKNDLYDGYDSGKAVINKADLPEYLKRLVEASKSALKSGAMTKELKKALDNAKATIARMEKMNAYPTAFLREAYKQLIDAAEMLYAEALEQSVKTAVEEKSRYYADRIAQTEQSRAAREAFIDKHSENEDVFGFKWCLNTAHKSFHFDICDFLAGADFGFGPGVYPKDNIPKYPAHPFCRCYFSVVYKHQIADGAALDMEKPREWLDGLPKEQVKFLFNENGLNAFKKGADWKNFMTGWDGFEERKSRFSEVFN